MNNRKRSSINFHKRKHRKKPHPNVNKKAWNNVGAKAKELGYDTKKMSTLYRKLEKKKNSRKFKHFANR